MVALPLPPVKPRRHLPNLPPRQRPPPRRRRHRYLRLKQLLPQKLRQLPPLRQSPRQRLPPRLKQLLPQKLRQLPPPRQNQRLRPPPHRKPHLLQRQRLHRRLLPRLNHR